LSLTTLRTGFFARAFDFARLVFDFDAMFCSRNSTSSPACFAD
jgi:hypothetical protein